MGTSERIHRPLSSFIKYDAQIYKLRITFFFVYNLDLMTKNVRWYRDVITHKKKKPLTYPWILHASAHKFSKKKKFFGKEYFTNIMYFDS